MKWYIACHASINYNLGQASTDKTTFRAEVYSPLMLEIYDISLGQ